MLPLYIDYESDRLAKENSADGTVWVGSRSRNRRIKDITDNATRLLDTQHAWRLESASLVIFDTFCACGTRTQRNLILTRTGWTYTYMSILFYTVPISKFV